MRRSLAVCHVAALALLGGCASAPPTSPAPPQLMPVGETAVHRSAARGHQTYECRARLGGAGPSWVYVAADLDLFGADGRTVTGKHLFPPAIWQDNDGSRIFGDVKARADAPQPGNAPWLLATARSTGGDGRLSKITSLQRVNTVGGVAPASVCDASSLGTRAQVPFSTEYIYFSK